MHMTHFQIQSVRKLGITLGVLTVAASPNFALADDSGFFGRLFRSGNTPAPTRTSIPAANASGFSSPRPPVMTQPVSNFDGAPAPTPAFGTVPESVSTPQPDASADNASLPKLTPRSRVNRPITNAEPILTRFALGRSNDGSQFAMFLELFADGTVLDSEGIHHVKQGDLKPVMEALQGSDFSKIRGHSGAPPTDFIDNVQIIVFDRRLGRLTAHPFSYSGNPQGCDPAIRHLHTALEGLQLKLSRPGQTAMSTTPATLPGAPLVGSQPLAGFSVNSEIAAPSGVQSGDVSVNPSARVDLPNLPLLPSPTLPDPSAGQVVRPIGAAGVTLPAKVSLR